MIDELDTFNARATLALARVARFPELYSPLLASAVALAVPALAPLNDSLEAETAERVFGHRKIARNLGGLYTEFWKRFPLRLEATTQRVTLNAPPSAPRGNLAVVTDLRLDALRVLPETWALPVVDDVVLFSEDGWSESEQQRLADHLQVGATVTLVRPGERCRFWFEACQVRHDFLNFLERLNLRFELERLHHSGATEPIMLTIFGLKPKT